MLVSICVQKCAWNWLFLIEHIKECLFQFACRNVFETDCFCLNTWRLRRRQWSQCQVCRYCRLSMRTRKKEKIEFKYSNISKSSSQGPAWLLALCLWNSAERVRWGKNRTIGMQGETRQFYEQDCNLSRFQILTVKFVWSNVLTRASYRWLQQKVRIDAGCQVFQVWTDILLYRLSSIPSILERIFSKSTSLNHPQILCSAMWSMDNSAVPCICRTCGRERRTSDGFRQKGS